ncbi:hypothetical protein Gpo141_00008899 [Globisporangium polare]
MVKGLSTRHEIASWLPHFMNAAATSSQLAMLECLHDHMRNAGCSAFKFAVRRGHIRIVEWFHEHYDNLAKIWEDDVAYAIPRQTPV